MKNRNAAPQLSSYVLTLRKAAEEAHSQAGELNSYVLVHQIDLAGEAALIRETAALLAHQVQHFDQRTKSLG